MKFDELGLPKVNGASDRQDSAMLAGMMTCFGWPQKVDLIKYIVHNENGDGLIYVRHPEEIKYDFSRDQTVPFIAGLRASGNYGYVHKENVTGKDFNSPSDNGHWERCQNYKANFFQDAWFWSELYFSAKFKPMDELNQLFCKLWIADDKFIKWYCNANKVWRESLRAYWTGWRDEKELCEFIIQKIEMRVK